MHTAKQNENPEREKTHANMNFALHFFPASQRSNYNACRLNSDTPVQGNKTTNLIRNVLKMK